MEFMRIKLSYQPSLLSSCNSKVRRSGHANRICQVRRWDDIDILTDGINRVAGHVDLGGRVNIGDIHVAISGKLLKYCTLWILVYNEQSMCCKGHTRITKNQYTADGFSYILEQFVDSLMHDLAALGVAGHDQACLGAGGVGLVRLG